VRSKVLHFHWLHPFVQGRPTYELLVLLPCFALQLLILRAMGRRIVWTVHNLRNHEGHRRAWEWVLGVVLGHCAHAVIAHSSSGAKQAGEWFWIPQRKLSVIPHGNYIGHYPDEVGRISARNELGLDPESLVVLFLGNIRPYKGVAELVRAFASIDGRGPELTLVIAGRVHTSSDEAEVQRLIGGRARVRFHQGFVPSDRVQVFMAAADIVAFPYREILTSGAVVLAMSFGKACIAPRSGCIQDVLDERGAFLYDSADEGGLRAAMESAASAGAERVAEMGAHNRKKAEQWSWERIAAATLDTYLGRPGGSRECLVKANESAPALHVGADTASA
jgi:beta-1,4-mannosyltransferase